MKNNVPVKSWSIIFTTTLHKRIVLRKRKMQQKIVEALIHLMCRLCAEIKNKMNILKNVM